MNKKLLILLCIILAAVVLITVILIVLLVNKEQALTEITIEQGTLVGSVSEDGTYTMYLGIPYAIVNASNKFQMDVLKMSAAVAFWDDCKKTFWSEQTEMLDDCHTSTIKELGPAPAPAHQQSHIQVIIHYTSIHKLNIKHTLSVDKLLIRYEYWHESDPTAPLPPPIWEEIFEATEPSASCLQLQQNNVVGEEDCLKINVYVPSSVIRPLPVMVWIHGGAFQEGSGGKHLFGPEFLIKHDIILVTLNYRLGPLGFLCLGIREAPGNAGLKDQVAALQWIKTNIDAFGGDPDNVTIFGESAGGMSVSLLVASNVTQGLFQRAIAQSGSSLSNLPFTKEPITGARLLAKEFVGYDTENPYELYEILSNIPVADLVSKTLEKPLGSFLDTDLIFSPCIEKDIPGVEPFITLVPYNLITRNTRNIPMIIGSNSKEGFLQASMYTDEEIENMNFQYLLPSDLEFESDEVAFTESEVIRMFYFGNNSISNSNMNEVIDFFTHMFFEVPALSEAEIMSKRRISPVYNYYFDYSGGRNPGGYGNITGAGHGDELMYLFNGTDLPYAIEENDQKIIDRITKLWTNFAKFGDPTPDFADDNPIKWEQNNGDEVELLYIQEELKMAPMPNTEAFTMWNNVFEKYRRLEPINY